MIKKELQILAHSLMFYTRLPLGRRIDYRSDYMAEAIRYFPFSGWVTGVAGALIFLTAEPFLPLSVSVLLAMSLAIIISGAMHEDGLADSADGLGGGSQKEQILRIMKDSATGTYGLLALIIVLSGKFMLLFSSASLILPLLFIAGQSVSRYSAAFIMFILPYVSNDTTSKSKDATGHNSLFSFVIMSAIGIAPLLLFFEWRYLLCVPFLLLVNFIFSAFLKKRIGGYTGDCIGAAQQISELLFYLFCAILWNFI